LSDTFGRRGWLRSLFVLQLVLLFGNPALSQPDEEFYGMFMNGRKIGWTKLQTENVETAGVRRVRLTAEGSLTVEMMGTKVQQESVVVSLCDEKLHPLSQEFRITSGQSTMQIRAQYKGRRVNVEVEAGGAPSRRLLTIPPDGVLTADSSFLTLGATPQTGTKLTVYYLNPLTITLDRAEVTVEAREKVTYAGQEHFALRILAKTPLGAIRSWEDPPGTTLWAELPLGIVMCRMPKDDALKPEAPMPVRSVASSSPSSVLPVPADFAVATSVAADKPIASPRQLRALSLELRGIPQDMEMISDDRQKVRPLAGEAGAFRFDIRVPSSPSRGLALPVRNARFTRYLGRDGYVDTANPEVRRLAERLRDRRSASRTASRIRAWVHANMKPDYSIGVLRSSADIIKRRRGVCRDYAILFAAIARAAGVPTRLVSGLVYVDGRFFYHAWAECWVGCWTAYDPTLPQDFVDATHVKLSQGDATEMMRVYQVIGKLSARILSVEG